MDKIRAEEILDKSGARLKGHFLLTSGRHSDTYMQCARILQYPNFAEEMIKELKDAFCNDNINIVVGPAIGGIVCAYELARQMGVMNIFAERVNGKMTFRRGFTLPKNARAIVCEDVITTGGSVKEVMDLIREQGGEVAGVAVLVDRSNGTIDFSVKSHAVYTTEVISYDEAACPLCKEGKLEAIKPGSRGSS